METKLTLRLNNGVIERAKIYAKSHKVSLSKMIESYLDSVTKEKDKEEIITPLVMGNAENQRNADFLNFEIRKLKKLSLY
mgnify:CR=1 FL=1